MDHLVSVSTLGNFDLSPYIDNNELPSFKKQARPVLGRRWTDYPPYPRRVKFTGRDGFGRDGEVGYNGAWSGRGHGDWDAGNGSLFLEQCRAEDCFFGCGLSHSGSHHSGGLCSGDGHSGGISIPEETGYFDDRGDFQVKREHAFGSPYSLASDKLSDYSRFPTFPQLQGIVYHGRRSSLPSSPTQPVHSRHRRLSEPFNEPASRKHPTNLSTRSNEDHHPHKDYPKPILFKTELCRSWEEKGSCRYGNKCQFAHSPAELRPVPRHPKYKTQLCKTFLEVGSCNYGSRCCFMHSTRVERSPSSASSNVDV